MYHTEGYVDEYTYFTKGHIYSFEMLQGGRNCYFWCVLPFGAEEPEGDFEYLLSGWFYQELGMLLDKGPIYTQKELNRLGECLKDYGSLHSGKGHLLLCLYYRNRLYFYGKEAEETCWMISGGVGVCISSEMTAVQEVMSCLAENMREATAKSGTEKIRITKSGTEGAWQGEKIAGLGNKLKKYILKALSEGRLANGYFLLWEDADVI